MIGKSEFTRRIQELGQLQTPEEMRAGLVELQRDVEADYDEHEVVVNERNQALQDNETLRQANMKLFLQTHQKDEPDDDPSKKKEPRKFENLFDEKGGLK